MPTLHVYARTEYAEPLAHLHDVEVDAGADPADLASEDVTADNTGDTTDWLEVAVIPADAAVWVIRDGELVDRASDRAPA